MDINKNAVNCQQVMFKLFGSGPACRQPLECTMDVKKALCNQGASPGLARHQQVVSAADSRRVGHAVELLWWLLARGNRSGIIRLSGCRSRSKTSPRSVGSGSLCFFPTCQVRGVRFYHRLLLLLLLLLLLFFLVLFLLASS